MPGLNQIRRRGSGIGHDLDGFGPVCGTDAGTDPLRGIDADLKVSFIRVAILDHHLLNAQLLESFTNRWNTDQSAAMLGHEVDGVWCHFFSGQDEISFVLAILIVHNHHHSSPTDIAQDGRDVVKSNRLLHVSWLRRGRLLDWAGRNGAVRVEAIPTPATCAPQL